MLDALRTSISGFVDSMQQAITSNCNSLSDAIRENVIMLQDSYKFISDHIAEIKFNYQQSTEAFTDAVNGAHRVNELAEKSISHSETSLDLVTKNNETMAAIAKTMQGKQEDIEKLAGSINEMSDAIENLQKLESLLNKIANKVK